MLPEMLWLGDCSRKDESAKITPPHSLSEDWQLQEEICDDDTINEERNPNWGIKDRWGAAEKLLSKDALWSSGPIILYKIWLLLMISLLHYQSWHNGSKFNIHIDLGI